MTIEDSEREAPVSPPAQGLIRVFLVDDHEVVRRGVAQILNAEPDMTVVGEADGVQAALRGVRGTRPDVVAGYVLKEVGAFDLVSDIRAVAAGRTLPASRANQAGEPVLRTQDPRLGSLGLRERQILGLIGEGLTNRQIGERLGLAEKTVKNYVYGLLEKLAVERRTQAAVLHAEWRHHESDRHRFES